MLLVCELIVVGFISVISCISCISLSLKSFTMSKLPHGEIPFITEKLIDSFFNCVGQVVGGLDK